MRGDAADVVLTVSGERRQSRSIKTVIDTVASYDLCLVFIRRISIPGARSSAGSLIRAEFKIRIPWRGSSRCHEPSAELETTERLERNHEYERQLTVTLFEQEERTALLIQQLFGSDRKLEGDMVFNLAALYCGSQNYCQRTLVRHQ